MNKSGLAPVLDKNTQILILGSLPGDESLRQQKYYAKNGNDFWRLLGFALKEDFASLDYDKRIKLLKKRYIGLWDVLKSSYREGSLDSNIKEEVFNDFSKLKNMCPNLRLVCFNGKKAAEYEYHLRELGYATLILPSSSGANRIKSEKRAKEWMGIRNSLIDNG